MIDEPLVGSRSMEQFDIELLDTRFSYSVKYGGRVYAHDFDSDIREQLQPEIASSSACCDACSGSVG